MVFVWECTKTSKSLRRPALYQSDLNTASPTPALIEFHIIIKNTKVNAALELGGELFFQVTGGGGGG